MTLKCLIVDDEPIAHRILEKYITETATFELSGNCYNAQEARLHLEKERIDLLFLDIQMPEINGIDFLKNLSLPQMPVTIITTAFRKYALDGFDLGVIDYLVKPIHFDRFTKSAERVKAHLAVQKPLEISENTTETSKNGLTVRSNRKQITIAYEDISHLEGLKDYTFIFTHDKKHLIKGYIKLIEEMLPAEFFIRVHKSFIVSKSRIKVVYKDTIEINEFRIPIGRRFKKEVLALRH
jgi:DNA-binding LytR/AlgR family response regulator